VNPARENPHRSPLITYKGTDHLSEKWLDMRWAFPYIHIHETRALGVAGFSGVEAAGDLPLYFAGGGPAFGVPGR
jgi:hypothetical protein